jgi:hypothetical protein
MTRARRRNRTAGRNARLAGADDESLHCRSQAPRRSRLGRSLGRNRRNCESVNIFNTLWRTPSPPMAVDFHFILSQASRSTPSLSRHRASVEAAKIMLGCDVLAMRRERAFVAQPAVVCTLSTHRALRPSMHAIADAFPKGHRFMRGSGPRHFLNVCSVPSAPRRGRRVYSTAGRP